MRLAAWNCCERFDRNLLHLLELDFDVAVVSECGRFETPFLDARELTSVLKLGVQGPGHTTHLGVLARAPWRVDPLPLVAEQPWLLPVRVTGPVDFTVLAVWALGPSYLEGRPSYACQTARVVRDVIPELDGPVVLAGDLNAPIASAPAEVRRHAENVRQLELAGLVSAYTAARGGADPLSEPTLYHQWKQDRPFHIDHVFVPRNWTEEMRVEVGSYEGWVATRRSDHVPVVVDLPVAGTAGSRVSVSSGA